MARKQSVEAVRVPFATLRALLGRPLDDAEVMTTLAAAGKVRTTSEYVIAKDAGFDFALAAPAGARRGAKKRLATLFLYPDGADGHRGFPDLPPPLTFSTRADLLAALPPPVATYRDGVDMPVSTPDDEVTHDAWMLDGFEVRAAYRDGVVRHVRVAHAEAPTTASSPDLLAATTLAVFPLDALPRPADAETDAELTPMALLVAWAADRFGLPPKHAGTPLGDELVAHEITPRAFLIGACNRTLTSLDFAPQLEGFLAVYTGHAAAPDAPSRAAANAKIKALLHLVGDRHLYTDDFRGTFASLDSPYYVPDNWEAVARIAPVIDARLADYEATKLRRPPRMQLYERAAEARDVWTVAPAKAH